MTSRNAERGSALVLAIFVLFLLTGLGVSLLFFSHTESRMSQADRRSKIAFYLAESGLENGRTTLFNTNRNGPFTDDLTAATGANGTFDFDPDAVEAIYDADGNVTGFTGYGDDVPLRGFTAADRGWYIAFLTNDALDGNTNTTDTNDRVLVTGIGAGRDRSFEIVQAVIELRNVIPTPPPATITLLGPDPHFKSGSSIAKKYVGDDCDGAGVADLDMPVIGTIGPEAEEDAEDGVRKPHSFNSGHWWGDDTVVDLRDGGEPLVAGSPLGTIDPLWLDCEALVEMLDTARYSADLVCAGDCTLPHLGPHQILFVDGDLTLDPTESNSGTLFVTGRLTMHGQTSWNGIIFVIGEGEFDRQGAGNGHISGGMIVADISGPDGRYGTDDDCSGGEDGFHEAYFDESGGGVGDAIYCTLDIASSNPVRPYRIVDFLQR